jgi:DNA-3-methyladenine glycosylase I
MEAPKKIRPKTLADYLEVLTKAVFQSGISWQVVEAKWEGFRRAFDGFDPASVAALAPRDVDRLLRDPSIIRNRRKVEATIDNAVEMLALDEEFGGFKRYLRSHDGFDAAAADLKQRFRFLGDLGAYYFLYVVGEKVPSYDEWQAAHPASGPGARGRGRKAPATPRAAARRSARTKAAAGAASAGGRGRRKAAATGAVAGKRGGRGKAGANASAAGRRGAGRKARAKR